MKVSFEFQLPAILADVIIHTANEAIADYCELRNMEKPNAFEADNKSVILVDTEAKTKLFMDCVAALLAQQTINKKTENEINEHQ